jgi:hypothetical protein
MPRPICSLKSKTDVNRKEKTEMRDQWKIKRVMGYTGYYRTLNSAGGAVKGSVWYEPSDKRYKWMASSKIGLQFGWSRTPDGAKRSCSRVMRLMQRWLNATAD